jgi:glycerate kinase
MEHIASLAHGRRSCDAVERMTLRSITFAPGSFKETLSAVDVAGAMAEGARRVSSAIDCDRLCPIGDGGDGTLDCLLSAAYGREFEKIVRGPDGRLVWSRLGRIRRADGQYHGVIEMALASGLAMVPPAQRDPMRTTSFGTGELMMAAMEEGCSELLVCIGGSATVDGGTGIAQACGFRFFDANDREITEPMCGGMLHRVARIERPLRAFPRVRVACDVTNPLCGRNGAATVYGPQKGATPEQVRMLDDGLAHLARVAGGDASIPGAGAAGGAGFGLMTFFNATLERGIDLVLDAVRFEERCRGSDLVITGEGRLDAQSLHGKACMGVAATAAKVGVPTIAIVGSTGLGAEQCVGTAKLRLYHSLEERFGRERAMRDTKSAIADLTEEVVRGFCVERACSRPR